MSRRRAPQTGHHRTAASPTSRARPQEPARPPRQNASMTEHDDAGLLLVDGSSYLYRAYHALPDLRNPAGEPTGAVRGMVAMLKKLREQFPSAHAACVFDAKGPTSTAKIFVNK